jgi:S1-C subfamily serine protease
MAAEREPGLLASLSRELAAAVAAAAPSVARVDDGSRLTASGLVWTADGVIVTTSHGVERDEELAVELGDGSRHAATLVGRDPDTDLAVLRVAATGLPAATRAGPASVQVGQLALAIGRPGAGPREAGAALQATIGIVSARLETEREGQAGYILHTDAVLYPGFSGGALVGTDGKTLGLVNRIFGRGRGVAVGTPVVAQVADALLAHGSVRRGYLGIRTQGVVLPAALRERSGLAQERGLLLLHVEGGSPADQASLLLGDTLLELDGQPVQDAEDLRQHLRRRAAGETLRLRLLRAGVLQEVAATLGAAT